jgi:hypothetical protein
MDTLLGDMVVSQVVEGDTERLITRLTNAGLAPKTIHNYIGTSEFGGPQAVRDWSGRMYVRVARSAHADPDRGDDRQLRALRWLSWFHTVRLSERGSRRTRIGAVRQREVASSSPGSRCPASAGWMPIRANGLELAASERTK